MEEIKEKSGNIPVIPRPQVYMAVQRAHSALTMWESLGFKKRGRLMMELRRVILRRMDEIAELVSKENGKPVIEAISHDIMPTIDLITWVAKKSEKLLKKETIKLGKWSLMGHRSQLEYYPYGVVAVISPWNFPFSIPMGEIVMALMTGNTVVFKPSEYTPLAGIKIGELFKEAGVPATVVEVVTGDGSTGAALVDSEVNKIVFTGSVATGKKIMETAAKRLIPITLELGGKDPLLVLPDADLDLASSAAVWGAFCNSGQVCASIERVYVHESIAERFTRLVVEKTEKLHQGPGGSTDVDVGSMTVEMQIKKVEQQVEDAKRRGATVLTGGERNRELGDRFYKPTVLNNVDHTFPVVMEETFGPVLPIMTYSTIDQAVQLANDSPYGLNAYVWGRNLETARKVASRLVAGTVNVNESVFTFAVPQTPWGGPKESGLGRTHGALGLLEMVRLRHVYINRRASKKSSFWWYPYSAEKLRLMKTLTEVLFGKGMARLAAAVRFFWLKRKVKTM
ncbi:MAG: aldehyde dehydrogenase family protein [Deltaproteobacteria bacterium]|nr:aldehyde dehydrogenase family protein [Deltaproteobacteria bacterium]